MRVGCQSWSSLLSSCSSCLFRCDAAVRSSEEALAAASSSEAEEETAAVSPVAVAATAVFPAGAEIPAAAALVTRCEQLPQNCLIRHNRGLQTSLLWLPSAKRLAFSV